MRRSTTKWNERSCPSNKRLHLPAKPFILLSRREHSEHGWPKVRGFVPRTKVLTFGHPFCVHMGFLQWVKLDNVCLLCFTIVDSLRSLHSLRLVSFRLFGDSLRSLHLLRPVSFCLLGATFITFTKTCFVLLIWLFVLFTSFTCIKPVHFVYLYKTCSLRLLV